MRLLLVGRIISVVWIACGGVDPVLLLKTKLPNNNNHNNNDKMLLAKGNKDAERHKKGKRKAKPSQAERTKVESKTTMTGKGIVKRGHKVSEGKKTRKK